MNLREFFYLRKSDRSAALFLLAALGIFAAIFYYMSEGQTATTNTEEDSLELQKSPISSDQSGQYGSAYRREKSYTYDAGSPRAERFNFDPNTADSTQLLRLGLQPWQVKNIYKYRAHGGVYRTKQDFARLYGLTRKQYRELEPYIHISSDYKPAADLVKDEPQPQREAHQYAPKIAPGTRIQVNRADTNELKTIPGIGSYYARQTVRYRDRLGGFTSPDQLREIDDFPEEALQYIEVDPTAVKKLNVNQLTLNQLKRHPYINFYQARAIADYRRLKGPLKSLEDLRLLKEFSDQDRQRLAPYLEF